MRTLLVAAVIVVLLAASGCTVVRRTGFWDLPFFEKGSRYKKTGKITDLLAEPTLDIGPRKTQFTGFTGFQGKWTDYFDVDGHGYFDVPVVATEQLPFALNVLMANGIRRVAASGPSWAREGVSFFAFFLGYIGGSTVIVGWGVIAVYDPIVHDIPVILVGKPVGMIRNAIMGPPKPEESRPSDTAIADSGTTESLYSIRRRELMESVPRHGKVEPAERDPEHVKAYERLRRLETLHGVRLLPPEESAVSSPILAPRNGRPVGPGPRNTDTGTPEGK